MGTFSDWQTLYNNTTVGDISFNGVRLRDVSNNYERLPDVIYDTSLNNYNQIPSMFKPTEYSKPAVSITDAIQEDEREMVIQENMLYAVGSITATTFLIIAIVLARE
jgi:hypothetical protein